MEIDYMKNIIFLLIFLLCFGCQPIIKYRSTSFNPSPEMKQELKELNLHNLELEGTMTITFIILI
jgi:hypothetical protein